MAVFVIGCKGGSGGGTSSEKTISAAISALSGDFSSNSTQKATTKYVVTIDNTAGEGVTLTVRYIDSDMQPVRVESGDKLDKGTVISAVVTNGSEDKLHLTAKAGKKLLGEKYIDGGVETEDGLYGIELTANVTITLSIVEPERTAFITIVDHAKEANDTEKEVINALHVYDPDTDERVAYSDGQEITCGRRVCVFVYNYATPVHLKITYKGEVVVDKIYPILDIEDYDVWLHGHDEKFYYTIDGDISIETTIAN